MRFQYFSIFLCAFFFVGCKNESAKLDNLNSLKREFISSIMSEAVDESPFYMHYTLRTIFFSQDVISLFGEVMVYDHLPHGWGRLEGKTYCKINGVFKEITLHDLFTTKDQKEFLRCFCENNLKYQNEQVTYFSGTDPLYHILDQKFINTFVLDDKFLIIVFQPYAVGATGDGPFIVKIPYEKLDGHWNSSNHLARLLPQILASKSYTASWNEDEFYNSLLANK